MSSFDRKAAPQPKSWLQAACWRLKCWIGLGSVRDGSICWAVSTRDESDGRRRDVWEHHDYHRHKGGDGVPAHFQVYSCWRCGRKFSI